MLWSQPVAAVVQEYEVKRSRFITLVEPVSSSEEIKPLLNQIRQRYKGANHYCSAWLLGSATGVTSRGKNDDGEPAGTAGQPMLSVLEHQQLTNILVVVVRYFGGIKLGAGGLVRAYSSAVTQALADVELQALRQRHHFSLQTDYAKQSEIEYQLTLAGAEILERSFAEQVTLNCASELQLSHEVKQMLHRVGASNWCDAAGN